MLLFYGQKCLILVNYGALCNFHKCQKERELHKFQQLTQPPRIGLGIPCSIRLSYGGTEFSRNSYIFVRFLVKILCLGFIGESVFSFKTTYLNFINLTSWNVFVNTFVMGLPTMPLLDLESPLDKKEMSCQQNEETSPFRPQYICGHNLERVSKST